MFLYGHLHVNSAVESVCARVCMLLSLNLA